ncbi:hypothetical protein [Xenorhabdus anantnagensis]|uniref:hypothetical protein n=1 Tax=Xenorhabdus anantnagensis TaxID=3025875 RepID=UPI00278C5CEA|nr:hypothetical protein [Xenorhabdus anantnagensis]
MRKELFDDLLASAKEAMAIHKGQLEPIRITKLAIPDVKAIYAHTGIKQEEFASPPPSSKHGNNTEELPRVTI